MVEMGKGRLLVQEHTSDERHVKLKCDNSSKNNFFTICLVANKA